jgi:hypothetical protein
MPRLPELDADNAPPAARPLFERDLNVYGQVLNSTRLAAYRPEIAVAAKQLGAAVAGGQIDAQLRLLLNVRVASLVGCPF